METLSFWNGKKVLVTGGAGFIGHKVVSQLVEAGGDVTVADDFSKGRLENLEPISERISVKKCNLLHMRTAKTLLVDVDVCFHMAAMIGGIGFFHASPAASLRDNSIMTFNLWDAALDTNTKMVCLSSSMVFEGTNIFPTPETALERSPPPKSGYGFSKLLAEYVARTYHEQYGVRFLIVRPFNAYGPGEIPGDDPGYAHVIPDLIKKVLSGQYPVEILGSGEQTRSYTFVEDIARAIIFLAERYENDDFNIGTGIETSVLDLAKRIWVLCGKDPDDFLVENVPGFQHDVYRRVPDISKLRQAGWVPRVGLDEGLATTVEWVKNKLSKA